MGPASSTNRKAVRIFLAAVTFVAFLFITGVVVFSAVMILVGPHAGLFPTWVERPIIGFGWLLVLTEPALLARSVWQNVSKEGISTPRPKSDV